VKTKNTLAKEAAREFVRQKVIERLSSLVDAQLDNAEGIKHLMMRDPTTGKFERVTGDARDIDRALKTKNATWIYTKDPSVQAFTDLLNRALDKPEQMHVTGDGSPIVICWQTPEMNSTKMRELPEGDVDEKIRHARKVNGHVESDGE
jgi:hypothetical protein